MTNERRQARRVRAIVVSLLAGTSILALKAFAYFLTGSMALASDTLEGETQHNGNSRKSM